MTCVYYSKREFENLIAVFSKPKYDGACAQSLVYNQNSLKVYDQ